MLAKARGCLYLGNVPPNCPSSSKCFRGTSPSRRVGTCFFTDKMMDEMTFQGHFQPPSSILFRPTITTKGTRPRPVTNFQQKSGADWEPGLPKTTAGRISLSLFNICGFFFSSLPFACVAWKQKVPLYQLLGINLRSSVGAGLSGETLRQGGRVMWGRFLAVSYLPQP